MIKTFEIHYFFGLESVLRKKIVSFISEYFTKKFLGFELEGVLRKKDSLFLFRSISRRSFLVIDWRVYYARKT